MARTYLYRRQNDSLLVVFDSCLQAIAERIATELQLQYEYLATEDTFDLAITGDTTSIAEFLSRLFATTGVSGLVIDAKPEEDITPIERVLASFQTGEVVQL